MKLYQTLSLIVLIFCSSFSVKAQACGFSFTTIFLKDKNDESIKNAKIELLGKDSDIENHLNGQSVKIVWLEEKNAYLISHGMCGEHFGVTLKISAEGYETLQQKINLSFGFQTFIAELKHKGTDEITVFEILSRLEGKVTDIEKAAIAKAKVVLTNKSGKKVETVTDENGYYKIADVSNGQYKIEFIGTNGFASSIYEKLELKKGQNSLDAILQIDMQCNCLVTEIICKPSEYNKEVLDCDLVTKNPSKKNQK